MGSHSKSWRVIGNLAITTEFCGQRGVVKFTSVGLGPARAVFKAARLARGGRKKSQTLIAFVRVGRSFKKSEPGQARTEWGRFGR